MTPRARIGLSLALAAASAICAACVSGSELARRDDLRCQAIGAQPGTGAYVQCRNLVMAQRAAQQQLTAAQVTAAGAALRDTPAPAAPVDNGPRIGGTTNGACFRTGEAISGLNKICAYNCDGSAAATTIGAAELCPVTIGR